MPSPASAPSRTGTPTPRVEVWLVATFVLFFARAFTFSTWVSRGPDVKLALDVNTVQFGLLTMLYPLGGLLAVNFGSALIHRFSSRTVAIGSHLVGAAALALLALSIPAGSVLATGVLLLIFGAPQAVLDFVSNYEGSLADKAARRSVFSVLHGAYGLGMLSAAAITGACSAAGISVSAQFLAVGVLSLVGVVAGAALPRHARSIRTQGRRRGLRETLAVWREPRTLTIAFIGFSFVLAEMAAGSWVPIALTLSGFSEASAAFALSLFWIVVTAGRLLGGLAVDAVGRRTVVLASALITALGLAIFALTDVIGLPYLGLVLWAAGMAVGFPMSASAMGDDPARAAVRINLIITIAYVSSVCVGPALGGVGQLVGLYPAFVIPLVLMLVAAALSGVTRPLASSASRM